MNDSKVTLLLWLRELLSGPYDRHMSFGHGTVGFRHLEMGLRQVFTNVALSRLRIGLMAE